MNVCSNGRVLKEGDKCVFDRITTDLCVCSRPLAKKEKVVFKCK